MFMRKSTLQKMLKELLGKGMDEIPALLREAKDMIGPAGDISAVKRELAELKLQKEMELRDIEHLVKIKEEKLGLEFQKKELTLKDEFKDKEMDLQKEYFEKSLEQINNARTEMKEIHQSILKRLPDIKAIVKIGDKH